MHFNDPIIKKIRLLLLPFSWLYGWVVALRNKLFDWHIFKSYKSPRKTICVGNISAGGTGKTPMVIYLTKILQRKSVLAILSRGYGRKTKGFFLASSDSMPSEIGDEPYLIYQATNEPILAVCEARKSGMEFLIDAKPEVDMILMDDGFQHRQVRPDFNIVLADYQELPYQDHYLPAGNLRDARSSLHRSDLIVITKCPETVSQSEMAIVKKRLSKYQSPILFSYIKYGEIYNATTKDVYLLNNSVSIVIVTGIANPNSLLQYVKLRAKEVIHLNYPDHYAYNNEDIDAIINQWRAIANSQKVILTTEKDAVKINECLRQNSRDFDYHILPITVGFIGDDAQILENAVFSFLEN